MSDCLRRPRPASRRSIAASAFFTIKPDPADHFAHPWVGFAVFYGYAAVLLTETAVLLVRRDV